MPCPLYSRIIGPLIGALLLGGIPLACCTPRSVVMRKWYEPSVQVLDKRTTAAMMLRQTQEIDDADYCLLLLKLRGRVSPTDTTTVYLPYEKWNMVSVRDTVRFSPKKYSDWRIKND